MTALDDGTPSQAAGLLASALAGGVAPDVADRVRAIVVPMLGD
jgi:hypothetical protein